MSHDNDDDDDDDDDDDNDHYQCCYCCFYYHTQPVYKCMFSISCVNLHITHAKTHTRMRTRMHARIRVYLVKDSRYQSEVWWGDA